MPNQFERYIETEAVDEDTEEPQEDVLGTMQDLVSVFDRRNGSADPNTGDVRMMIEHLSQSIDALRSECRAIMAIASQSLVAVEPEQEQEQNQDQDQDHEGSATPLEVVRTASSSSDKDSTSSSERDADSSSVSSSSNSDSDDSATSSTSSAVEEVTSKQDSHPGSEPISSGIPFKGKSATTSRNDRRKRQRTLQRLVNAGHLSTGSTFKTLEAYIGANGVADAVAIASKSVESGGQSKSIALWDYPDEPEDGWQRRLIVKEVECEREAHERAVPVKQYEEDVERGRKRRRPNCQSQSAMHRDATQEEDIVLGADMYGEPATNNDHATVEDFPSGVSEAGEVIDHADESGRGASIGDDSDLPALPKNLIKLPFLSPTSRLLSTPGTIIAFRYMEMRNFEPVFSEYKTARLLESDNETLTLELAKRDRDEPMFDYEGERIPGLFEVLDNKGNPIEGRLRLQRGDMIDTVLIEG